MVEVSPKNRENGRELLALVGRGDAAALERFYELAVDGLYAFVFFRSGKDAATAEDVVQETFIAALDQLAQFDESRGSLRSWLCQLSRNVLRAHLTEKRRTEEIDMWDRVDRTLLEAFERIEREALVDEIIERRETQELVHLALGHLPDPYRRALEDKYVEDKTLADMAAELGLSEDAVKSLLARARRAFRETFQTLTSTLAEIG